MKNETKTGLTSEAKLAIPGCDYWGTYDGYKIYKCYNKVAPNYSDVVFALGNALVMNGVVIGRVDSAGRVSGWEPEKAKNVPTVEEIREVLGEKVKISDIDAVIDNSWKRTVEDLVGKRLSIDNIKYSE